LNFCDLECLILITDTTKAIREIPSSFEIKNFLVSHMSEVADMMLAEDQEINALELVGNARESKRFEISEEKANEYVNKVLSKTK